MHSYLYIRGLISDQFESAPQRWGSASGARRQDELCAAPELNQIVEMNWIVGVNLRGIVSVVYIQLHIFPKHSLL